MYINMATKMATVPGSHVVTLYGIAVRRTSQGLSIALPNLPPCLRSILATKIMILSYSEKDTRDHALSGCCSLTTVTHALSQSAEIALVDAEELEPLGTARISSALITR